jgi:two-component system, cell cycle response regulator
VADRVLIVDDERTLARVLGIRFRTAGFTVDTAFNGESGIASAVANMPAAIVLDVRMPDLDGFEVLERLRADPRTCSIPVVFLSANVQDSARSAALAAGAFAYLTKPYEPADVIGVVTRALDSRQRSA